jgi:hypothetical protein
VAPEGSVQTRGKAMNVRILLPVLVAAAALVGAAVAQAGGPPAGEGANGCYQLFAGGSFPSGPTQLVVDAKFNVGNPASVLVAGNCDGGPIGFVDDGLTVAVSNPSPKGGGTLHRNFFNFCGGANSGGAALDVTDLFKPGPNSFSLTITNECGGLTSSTPLFLVVSQH